MLKIWRVGACGVEQGWGMLLLLFEVQMEHSSMQLQISKLQIKNDYAEMTLSFLV